MAQRPRELRPEQSPAHLLGARLRALRVDRGLSLAKFGKLVYTSGDTIGKVEKGMRRPKADLIHRCDTALGADGSLIALMSTTDSLQNLGIDEPDEVLAGLPLLRRVLDSHDYPEDGPVRPLPTLRAAVGRLVRWRLNSDYAVLGTQIPLLLPELQRLVQTSPSAQSAALLAQAYRAADAIADKYGLFDLSARIIELMRASAAASGDPLTVAAAEYVRAETFFATNDWGQGRRMLERAAASIQAGESVDASAIYGSLCMRAAILAARGGDVSAANEQMGEAAQVCRDVPEGIYRGTAFGPATVRIHRVSLALDSHDIDSALAIGREWTPPPLVPAERRSHFFVDLARSWLYAGKHDQAVQAIRMAWSIAPQHIGHQAEVRNALAWLIARAPRPSAELLRMSRQAGLLSAG
jgi:transcriptional regulator with XRE-family HTH domain